MELMNNYSINDIINNDGKSNYAFVTMVIKNDIYASASIVFAESVRKIGCLSKLIVMVDNNISDETLDGLKKYYDEIIQIDTIYLKNHSNPVQQVILSKLHAMKLIEYEKILLIDVDTVLFKNADMILLNLDCNYNKVYVSWINKEPNYGFMIIKPSMKIYDKMLKFINKHNDKLTQILKPFEYVITKTFKQIKKLPYKLSQDKYDDVDGIQYKKYKPFLMAGPLTIEQRMNLDHFKIWFTYLKNIINKYPEIKKYKFMKEPISVSVYFLESISRFIVSFVNSNQKNKNMSQIYLNEIDKKNNYYHLDISKECANTIGFGDDLNLLSVEYFISHFLNNDFNDECINIKSNKKNVDIKDIIDSYINSHANSHINLHILNIILGYYIKTNNNTFVVLEITDKQSSSDFNVKTFKDDNQLKNNMIYSFELALNGLSLKNILFNVFQKYTYTQRLMYLSSLKNNTKYTTTIKIFETIGQIDNIDYNFDTNFFVFFSKDAKIKISSLLLNANSIEMFNDNDNDKKMKSNEIIVGKFSHDVWDKCIISRNELLNLTYFQTLKKWIYDVYTLTQLNNIILIPKTNNNYVLIDNNTYGIMEIKKIIKNKIFFVSIIFSKISQYKKILLDYPDYLKQLYGIKYYWEYEGIKIAKIN